MVLRYRDIKQQTALQITLTTIASSTKVDENVYNGTWKMEVECEMLMSSYNISECINKIKLKN